MASSKSTPKDAQVMASILKEIGIQDYEPRVLNQMLEFTYRYVTNLVDDAQIFSTHAKKKTIDKDDIKVAAEFQCDKYFTIPPPRELLMSVARQKNNAPLPVIKATTGIRLPPDRYSLTACNYRMRYSMKKLRGIQSSSRLGMTMPPSATVSKFSSVGMNGKSGSNLSVISKPSIVPPLTVFPRNVSMASTSTKTPTIKFSDGSHNLPPVPLPTFSEHGVKRKLDDDADDYDVE